MFQIARRTGNLTEKEKEERRQATQAKHYLSHKAKILERSKKRRLLITQFVQTSQQLTVFAQSALQQRRDVRQKVDDYGKELERIYGRPEDYDIKVFMRNYQTPISYGTFAMLLLYFTPQESLPNPLTVANNPTAKAVDFLPTDTHYRQLSKLIHPDRQAPRAEYQSLANASWELWKQNLLDPKAKNALVPPNPFLQAQESAEYCAQGDVFRRLTDMFYAYLALWCHVSQTLNPSKLTPNTLYRSLRSTEESRRLLHASLDDGETGMRDLENGIEEVIAQGKRFAALPLPRQKRNAESGRGPQEETEEDESEEEEEDTSEVSNGRKRLRTETPIDPALRTLRPRRPTCNI